MSAFLQRMWQEQDGVLSFDWVLLVTIVVFGLISGVTAARDAIIDEFGDTAEATLHLDQSYTYPSVEVIVAGRVDPVTVYGSTYNNVELVYNDCGRAS